MPDNTSTQYTSDNTSTADCQKPDPVYAVMEHDVTKGSHTMCLCGLYYSREGARKKVAECKNFILAENSYIDFTDNWSVQSDTDDEYEIFDSSLDDYNSFRVYIRELKVNP